ncbi:hypothetical protein BGZ95_000531 [Linnemannia exigua]|uniref:Amino acid transporter transmembrane domain-containing protein n=1 Tax=Linnemannia exigua TaxID=604196 RepID=A0AAD4HCB1_9FUNG|nr:hypothetical protein BGZ95_000531 [Linnemannia exigua]
MPPGSNKVQRVSSDPTSVCSDAMSFTTTTRIGAHRLLSNPPSDQSTLVGGFFGRIHHRLSLSGPSLSEGASPLHRQQSVPITTSLHESNEAGEAKPIVTVTAVAKDISFWGGLCLLICNTTGPGVVTLPLVAQSGGWVPTVFGFALVGVLSFLSCMFVCEAMTEVPGNDRYQANVEFSQMVSCFLGRRYQALVQIICFLALQTTIIASIAICAQLFDNLLIRIAHRTCGIQVYPSAAFVCVSGQLPSSSPFSGTMIMSTGALIAMILIVPLCLMNLSENIWLQTVSCVVILMIFVQWIVTFFQHGLDTSRVPAVGSDVSQTFGSILFNYAFITAVPSWANAKQSHVSPHKTVGSDVSIMTTLFVLVSVLGGMAYAIPENSSMIQAINSSPDVTTLSQIAGYTFPIAALVTSIPINMIVLRYNLVQSKTCQRGWADVLAGGLPWLVAIPCMTGSGLSKAVEWSSLFLVSSANFVIPFVLYIYSKKYRARLMRMTPADRAIQERLDKELCGTLTAEEIAADMTVLTSPECDGGYSGRSSSLTQSDGEETEDCVGERGVGKDTEKGHSAAVASGDSLDHTVQGESRNVWNEKDRGGSGGIYSIPDSTRPGSSTTFESELPDSSSFPCKAASATEPRIVTNANMTAEFRYCMSHCAESVESASKATKGESEEGKTRAIPLSSPVSGLAIAYCALTLLLIGIGATIIIKIVQLA